MAAKISGVRDDGALVDSTGEGQSLVWSFPELILGAGLPKQAADKLFQVLQLSIVR